MSFHPKTIWLETVKGNSVNKLSLLTFACLLCSYASPSFAAPKPKAMSFKEATAFEAALLSRPAATPRQPERLFVQPVNKTESCKLPTTSEQITRSNFRAYWDGDCRNGYAYGLGRDIAISDTHHVEEITIHGGSADDYSGPSVVVDYVNNQIVYSVRGDQFPATTTMVQRMETSVGGFNVAQTLVVNDGQGRAYVARVSPFDAKRDFFLSEGNGTLVYRFIDNTAQPPVNLNVPAFLMEAMDPRTKIDNGIGVASFPNGIVRHMKMVEGQPEAISLAPEYVNHLMRKNQELGAALIQAQSDLQRAQQIEREYLYKACNGKSYIRGLDNSQYTAICTWRDQFKAPYAAASERYQNQLAAQRRQVADAEQQRQAQQQIDNQQAMMRAQQNQQELAMMNQTNREIEQQSQQLRQQSQQFLQTMQTWQPYVQPLTPLGGNRVVCNTVGITTICR